MRKTLASLLATVPILFGGCEGGDSGTSLYEARTGREIIIVDSYLRDASEYTVRGVSAAGISGLMYTDIKQPDMGRVLFDNRQLAIDYYNPRSSSGDSDNTDTPTTTPTAPSSGGSSSGSSSGGSSGGSGGSSGDAL